MTTGKPKWPLDDTLRRAEDADRLVDEHGTVLGDRIEADTGEKLKAGIVEMRAVSKGVPLTNQKSATALERDVAQDAHDLIMLFREAARGPKGSPELRAAMGVGETLTPAVTQKVLDALTAVAANAEALRACGAGQADIDNAAELATKLAGADRTQAASMRARASATDSHIALLLRVQALVEAVSIAGKFAFRKDKAVRERFEALLATSGDKGTGGGGENGGEGGAGGPTSGEGDGPTV